MIGRVLNDQVSLQVQQRMSAQAVQANATQVCVSLKNELTPSRQNPAVPTASDSWKNS